MAIRYLKPNLLEIQERLFPSEPPALLDAPVPLFRESYERPRVQIKLPRGISPRIDEIFERSDLIRSKLHKQTPGNEGGGQVVCVESLKHDDLGAGEAALPSAVFVLLDKPKFASSDTDSPELYKLMTQVWQGWVVASDMDYMTEWDVRLNDDELRENDCQFVQTWNRVELYLPTVHRVAGNVSSSLLSNIRFMSEQFATGKNEATTPAVTAIGELVQRKLPFGWIQTGTLLVESNDKDPRNNYVSFYGQFAALFSEAIWSMLQVRKAELSYAHTFTLQEEAKTHDVLQRVVRFLKLANVQSRPELGLAASNAVSGTNPTLIKYKNWDFEYGESSCSFYTDKSFIYVAGFTDVEVSELVIQQEAFQLQWVEELRMHKILNLKRNDISTAIELMKDGSEVVFIFK